MFCDRCGTKVDDNQPFCPNCGTRLASAPAPGGMVEPGETLQEALIREIQEETGADAEITGFVGVCKNVKSDIVNIDFICRYRGGELRTSDESLEVRWVSKKEAMDLITFPMTKKRLENMLSGSQRVSCFNFRRDPFEIVLDETYEAGDR